MLYMAIDQKLKWCKQKLDILIKTSNFLCKIGKLWKIDKLFGSALGS